MSENLTAEPSPCHRGTLNLEAVEPGRNTFWAPEILWAGNLYHMFVSYITGVPDSWRGNRDILHYSSENLWDWHYESRLTLSSRRVIDACVYPVGNGWRMWYKDEAHDSHTWYADSPDLYRWQAAGEATTDQGQEGPNVFRLGDRYWLIADVWDGLAAYWSEDLTHWTRQPGTIMRGAGTRREDENRGHHADVLTVGGNAYIFYFVHPTQENEPGDPLGSHLSRRSSLQTAKLQIKDGRLTVIRDEPFDFDLPDLTEDGLRAESAK